MKEEEQKEKERNDVETNRDIIELNETIQHSYKYSI